MKNPTLTAPLLAALATLSCHADDFETEDFSLRFSAALSRLSSYGDVAGQGGASAASIRASSVNPAALAWLPNYRRDPRYLKDPPRPELLKWAVSTQYAGLAFHRGSDIWAATQTLLFFPSENCALRISATQLRSNEGIVRDDALFEVDANVYRLEYSHRLPHPSHPSAFGLQLSYSETEINASIRTGDRSVEQFQRDFRFTRQIARDSDREAFSVRLGWQTSFFLPRNLPPEFPLADRFGRLLLGAVVDYSYQPTKLGTFYPQPDGFPAGEQPSYRRRGYHQVLARAGVAVRFTPNDWILEEKAGYLRFDYQWAWLGSQHSELQTHRLYLGMNFPFGRHLHLNAGAIADDRRRVAWTVGASYLGEFFGRPWVLEAAYQHDLLPEIAHEFGHADSIVLSAGIAF
jgi:hypothetical protein